MMRNLRPLNGFVKVWIAASLSLAVCLIPLTISAQDAGQNSNHAPQYTPDGKLVFPADYREWKFITSGHGMTYGPTGRASTAPLFDNVFVNPEAYAAFQKTGRWPDQSTFVLEIRRAATEGSINNGGEFQKDLVIVEVEVKDESHFDGGWGYFEFPGGTTAADVLPKTADCYSCHMENTAVEQTFVQFYPTLMPVAREKATVKKSYGNPADPEAN